VLKEIATVLRNIGSLECLEKAGILEADASKTITLTLRNLGLKSIDAIAIAHVFKQEKGTIGDTITSISFSYNRLLGDMGATVIAKSLPASINEIGCVDCGIGDTGGMEILRWMKTSTHLQMICMEQNNFSETLKTKFKVFKINNPRIIVVI
jgi:hypothetical protein